MHMHTRTGWNYLMIALTAVGLLAVGAFFLHTGTTALAQEANANLRSSPPPKEKKHTCKSLVTVKVNDQFDNLVEPETFTVCQDHGSHGHFSVIWQNVGSDVKNFRVEFQTPTPFQDNTGSTDVSVFGMDTNGNSTPLARTKDLGLSEGEYKYFKYRITVCRDDAQTDCDTQDPGGVFVH